MVNETIPELSSALASLNRLREDAASEARQLNSLRKFYRRGISVIIPVYLSVDTLGDTLASLSRQTLDQSLFEVILVLNGPDDGVEDLIDKFIEVHPSIEIRKFRNLTRGASAARNLGLSLHRRQYVIFLDADDLLQENFLRSAFELADEGSIVVNPIFNLSGHEIDKENALNRRIANLSRVEGDHTDIADIPWILGFNACKLIPSNLLEGLLYDVSLVSGEDLVFFANLLASGPVRVITVSDDGQEAYVRRVLEGSVSRQKDSFEFNVAQRLACIIRLDELQVPTQNQPAVQALIDAQLGFIQRYTSNHPSEIDTLEGLVAERKFMNFPWDRFNKGKAEHLVISYCFSPFSDSSATVAEKAVSERRKVVDVISNDMSAVRRVDPSLKFLSSRWVENRHVVSTPSSFAGSIPISQFAAEAVKIYNRSESAGRNYRTMYSRALWAGSHVAAALVKSRHPELMWTAEFSDPLRFGADGAPRTAELADTPEIRELTSVLASSGFDSFEIRSLFDLVEAVTLLMADEVVFTNLNQREYMLREYSDQFAEMVNEKSIVRAHPSPAPSCYKVVDSDFLPAPNRVNIGYFGSFYANRGLDEIFVALANLSADERSHVKLHIFCNTVAKARDEIESLGLADVVVVNGYLPYMEFLNATTKFDVLIVNDVSRSAGFDINPFLPSKYSDIRTSGAKVWGIVDEGSPLSSQPLDFRSNVGDQVAALKTLKSIIRQGW